MGRWIPSDIMWWISIRRINSVFVCGILPRHKLILRHQTRAVYHPLKFHHVVCLLLKTKKKKKKSQELEVGNRRPIPEGTEQQSGFLQFFNVTS